MTDIICITGFLGSGKTTLLNRILPLCLNHKKVAVIENDFGDTGIDAGLVAETGAAVRELASGCICCSLRGELKAALQSLVVSENPDLIFIEPSGISRSSDILSALESPAGEGLISIINVVNLVDVSNFEDYLESFGDFYGDQISSARTILFSHQRGLSQERLDMLAAKVSGMNPGATCFLSDWLELNQETLWDFIKGSAVTAPEQIAAKPAAPQGRAGAGVFSSWSGRPDHAFNREELESILDSLAHGQAGPILRAKGFCRAADDSGWHFDYLTGHSEIRPVNSFSGGQVLVIGQILNAQKLTELFRI
ncbi:MAG: GTP-binding protein [Candidatus Adiutrix sp.]|jgi:G3E family GTPase|nr:GTP-binding protein [Candidatus Adiutrix sp.]